MGARGKLRDVSRAVDDGFTVADVRSDPSGVDVELRRGELQVEVHLDREEARSLLRGETDVRWVLPR